MTRSEFQGPPDDPSEAPTGLYDYSGHGQPQPDSWPTPWYRKRNALIGLGSLAAILLGLVIFGVVELTDGVGPSSPTSTKLSPVTTTAPTTTSFAGSQTTPAPTTTLSSPPTSGAATTTTPPTSTSIDQGHHHHHPHDGGMP